LRDTRDTGGGIRIVASPESQVYLPRITGRPWLEFVLGNTTGKQQADQN
jgi:hypothetical protein